MTEQPDPGHGWRLASGDDYKDERCEFWEKYSKSWIARNSPGDPFDSWGDCFYRIPIDAPQPDLVNDPPHYRQGTIECIDAIRAALTEEEFRGFCKGNVIGYVWRERHKGGDEDIDKSIWYLERLANEKTE